MTVESLISDLTQYVSWLYDGKEWAGWELLTVVGAASALLLLLIVRRRRKAAAGRMSAEQTEEHAPTIGTRLDARKEAHQEPGNLKSRRLVSISKGDGNQKRWKETTRKWKNFQKLIEQLQYEVTEYKRAEQGLEQQFTKLKAANERLMQEIAKGNKVTQNVELDRPLNTGRFGQQQGRILSAREVLVEDS
jgi:hypothetical protein